MRKLRTVKNSIAALLSRNNGGMSLRQSLLSGAPFSAPLTYSAVPQRAATGTTGTFTRATASTWKNNDGYLVTGVAGEIGFVGARRVRNLLNASETFSGWTTSTATVAKNIVGPDGVANSGTTLTATGSNALLYNNAGPTVTGNSIFSVQLKRISGTGNVQISPDSGATYTTVALTSDWQRFSVLRTAGVSCFPAIRVVTNGDVVGVAQAQYEDVTAQTTQTAGEYVSVGVVQRNKWTYSSEFDNAAWTKTSITVVANDAVAPDGTTSADKLTNDNTSSVLDRTLTVTANTVQTDSVYLKYGNNTWARILYGVGVDAVQLWINLQTGVIGTVTASNGTATISIYSIASAANGFWRVQAAVNLGGAITALQRRVYLVNADNSGTIVSGAYAHHWGAQIESGSTATEYQAVGGSYIYHGSGVDGVKAFPYDINGSPIPSSYTYDAVSLNGVAGTYVSTPDSVANSITGDIDLRYYGPLNDWTPSTLQALINKDNGVGGNRSFEFYVTTAAKFEFAYTNNGTSFAGRIATSSVANTLTDGSPYWARVTYASATGKVNFYTSTDGSTWTALGTEQTITSGTIYDGTSPVEVGAYSLGTAGMLSGKCYRAQIYNGINGTLAVDFNASRYAGGTTLTGSTGETWTLQGNAIIHPTNQPLLGYQEEGARTNYALWNRDLTNVVWTKTSCTAALTATGADNAVNSASTLTATAGNATCLQSITRASAQRVTGCKIKRRTGTGTINMTQDNGVTWTPVTVTSAYTNVAIPAATAANPIIGFQIVTNGDAIDIDYVMHEEAAFVSSSIATTTIAVARNQDSLVYSSAGNIDGTKGWAYCEVTSNEVAGNQIDMIDLVAAGNPLIPILVNAGNNMALLDPTTTTRAFNAMTPRPFTTPVKFASTWSASGTTGTYNGASPPALQTYSGGAVTNPIAIGSRATGAAAIFGTIRNVRLGQSGISSSSVQAVTAP